MIQRTMIHSTVVVVETKKPFHDYLTEAGSHTSTVSSHKGQAVNPNEQLRLCCTKSIIVPASLLQCRDVDHRSLHCRNNLSKQLSLSHYCCNAAETNRNLNNNHQQESVPQ
jgi:hypothetical protein